MSNLFASVCQSYLTYTQVTLERYEVGPALDSKYLANRRYSSGVPPSPRISINRGISSFSCASWNASSDFRARQEGH